jgi:type III secretion system FlhB-like substrate exporter
MNNKSVDSLVALEYRPEFNETPIISIQSNDAKECKKILEYAKKYNIPVISDPLAVEQLLSVEEGDSLPEKLFKTVAELFITVDKILTNK